MNRAFFFDARKSKTIFQSSKKNFEMELENLQTFNQKNFKPIFFKNLSTLLHFHSLPIH